MRTLYRLWVNLVVLKVTTMKDELFMLFTQDGQNKINVYDVNDWEEVKDVIALPGISPSDIEGCSVSDCVYALCENVYETSASVLRITKDEEQRFNVQPWISNLRYPAAAIFVSATGVLSVPNGEEPDSVSIYDANGSLVLSADIYMSGYTFVDRVIQKSNGNLVLASISGDNFDRVLTEINMQGRIQRQYVSSLGAGSTVSVADMYDGIVIYKLYVGMELLDSEFNRLDFTSKRLMKPMRMQYMHYSYERDELISCCAFNNNRSFLKAFYFNHE